jgi:3-deoxy-D-manno-octulosonic acid (KDO) 8-phosphate synthase
LERVRRIKDKLGVPVLSDIAMLNEAVQAAKAGAVVLILNLWI